MKMHKQYMGKAHINNMERVLDGGEEIWVLPSSDKRDCWMSEILFIPEENKINISELHVPCNVLFIIFYHILSLVAFIQ